VRHEGARRLGRGLYPVLSSHPSSDDQAHPCTAVRDAGDIRSLTLLTDAVHAAGSPASIELWHGGSCGANLASRLPSIGVSSMAARGEPGSSIAATGGIFVSFGGGIGNRRRVRAKQASMWCMCIRAMAI